MKNRISDIERLHHILSAINTIQEFSKGLSYEEYLEDFKLRLALVKLLEIIGEASVGLSKNTTNKFSNVEWTILKSVRNVLVHEYFGIDYKIIWNSIQNKVPELRMKIEQIEKHGERIGTKVISHEYGSDPASVGFDAIKYAEKNFINCVLIDTAGRMHTSKNLLKEIEKISRVCKPDLKLFIGEAITGNDSIEQVKSFDWSIGIDGIILTKADTDEKGGTATHKKRATAG